MHNHSILNFNGTKFYYENHKIYKLEPFADVQFYTVLVDGEKIGYISGNKFTDNNNKNYYFINEPTIIKPENFNIWSPKNSFIIDCFVPNNIAISETIKEQYNMSDNAIVLDKFHTFDSRVYMPKTKEDIHKIVEGSMNIQKPYKDTTNDCDDFAFRLNVYAKYWNCNGIFIISVVLKRGGLHALNMTFTEDNQMWIIEPQNGCIYKSLDDANIKTIYGVVQ